MIQQKRPAIGGPSSFAAEAVSDEADVRGLRPLPAGTDREAHALAVHRRLQAAAAQRGDMQEDVRAALVGSDEAETAIRVEEFHGAVIGALDRSAVAILETATAIAVLKAAAAGTAVLVAATEIVARRTRTEATAARRGRRRLG